MFQFQHARNLWCFLIVVLLAFGIFFRVVNLDRKPYWGDESLTSQRISGYIDREFKSIVLQNDSMTAGELQSYQRPNPNKNLQDVMYALANHGEHPPLYYLMARFWMQLFPNRVATPRGLSSLISLVAMPCFYLLCLELFESSFVAWIAVGLLAISPIQIIYAQEARQYSLWTVTILLSSWALFRAIRINSKSTWRWYILTLFLSLYTHLISVIIVAVHGIYILFHEGFRLSKRLVAYGRASLAGIVLFIPWMMIAMLEKIGGVDGVPGWSKTPTPLASLAQTWLLNISRIFIDLNDSFAYKDLGLYMTTLAIALASIYVLYDRAPKRISIFIVLLIIIPALFLILPDLILGGRRSTPIRYFIPSSLGIQMAVAYFIYSQLNISIHLKDWKNWLRKISIVAIVSSGIYSGILISQADTWWFKGREYYHNEVAKIVNQTEDPIVIATWFDLRTLCHSLDSDVVLQDIRPLQEFDTIDDRFSYVFVYQSQEMLNYLLDKNSKYKVETSWTWKRQTTPVNTTLTNLWKLSINESE